LMSWALQNHWMVNFKASQGGEIPLRYRLTTHAGPVDDVAAARFGAESATPPVTLRDYLRTGPETGRFLDVPAEARVLMTAKPAEDGDGVVVRVQNLAATEQTVLLRFPAASPRSAVLTSPVEIDADALAVSEGAVSVPVTALAVQSVRVRF
jgi:alpha-mannosidase